MELADAYKRFPTRETCVWHLERVLWRGKPVCPYCRSTNQTLEKGPHRRRHCNNCNTSYSVTVGTVFHHTHVDLQRWFTAISLVLADPGEYSARRLAGEIAVTKDTACRMLFRIRNASAEETSRLKIIAAIKPLKPLKPASRRSSIKRKK